jgi:4-amino-4-deoxy-L-arabinose transferase-like glycosyltransferase
LNKARAIRSLTIAFAFLFPLLAFFTNLATLGLLGPDEPRYAWIARAMAQTHDWVTPRLYGQPWFEKPILYYWAAGIGFKYIRSGEIAARLPSALAALIATLAIAWLARRQYGNKIAWFTMAIFPTTVGAIGFSHAATPDMLFTASLACAMAFAAAILRRGGQLRRAEAEPESQVDVNQARIEWALFGVSLGAATLAKGPAALVLTGGSLALWALSTKNAKVLLRFLHPVAIAAFALLALPWYAACAARNHGFLSEFLFHQNVDRFLTPAFQHQQPFWFFGPIILMALLPWTILLIPAGAGALKLWRNKSWHSSPGFFLACWAAFPIAFFSLSQSKLPGYILPSIPPLAILLAVGLVRWIDAEIWITRYVLIGSGLTLWAILYFFVKGYTTVIPAYLRGDLIILEFLVFFVVSVSPIVTSQEQATGMLAACVMFVLLIGGLALSIADLPISTRALVPKRPWFAGHPREPIALYHANRNCEFGLNFYLGRQLPEWSPAKPGAALVFTTPDGADELSKLPSVAASQPLGNPMCVRTEIVNAGH